MCNEKNLIVYSHCDAINIVMLYDKFGCINAANLYALRWLYILYSLTLYLLCLHRFCFINISVGISSLEKFWGLFNSLVHFMNAHTNIVGHLCASSVHTVIASCSLQVLMTWAFVGAHISVRAMHSSIEAWSILLISKRRELNSAQLFGSCVVAVQKTFWVDKSIVICFHI